MNNALVIFDVDINYKNSVLLYEKTGFSISTIIIKGLCDKGIDKFTIDGVDFRITLLTLFTDKWCDNGYFNIFVESTADEDTCEKFVQKEENKKLVYNKVKLCIDSINEAFSEYKIPIDNLDNVVYLDNHNKFYQEIGVPAPTLITVKCELNQTIDDVIWN